MTPVDLVEDVLVGSGILVSGVSYTGHPDAIGSFNGAATNLGLNSGILLTTGTVKDESGGLLDSPKGPHGPNDSGSAGKDNGEPGYGPLTTLAGSDTYNAAILEFDFIPQSDTVKFRYVFGSEEYPEFVDGGFNDAFAFFISGPGFGGDYNMAKIPGGGGIVSIDNVNNGSTNSGPCQNCSYYVNNGTGSTSPEMDSDYYIQYDGFTKVLTAWAEVQCGETYHLKIAIADAGDGAYDSGIFLEANSLASIAPISISSDLNKDAFADGMSAAEGCETITVTVSRIDVGDVLTLPVSAAGTATEGVDYETLPASVTFPVGVAEVSFDVDVYSDFISEGTESLIIQVVTPDPCGGSSTIDVVHAIVDVDPLVVTLADMNVHCPLEEAVLIPIVTGGLPDFVYDWGGLGSDETLTVNPSVTTDYTITVTDGCIGDPVSATASVIVPDYPPMIINTTPDTSVLCPNTPLVLAAEVSGGEGSYTYIWTVDGTTVGTGPILHVSPMVTTTYTVGIMDGCGELIETDITVTVIASVLELEMSPEVLICPGDSVDIWTIATEGLGDYTYYWMHSGETTATVNVSPPHTTTYTVSVEDACHTYSIEGSTKVKVIRPKANFYILNDPVMEGLMVNFQNACTGDVAWDWDFGNGDQSTIHSPNTVYDGWGWYNVTLIAYNEIGCTDTITKPIYIKPEFYFFAPNAFTPERNGINDFYAVSCIGSIEFEFQIYNRWGEMIWYTKDPNFQWDGKSAGHLVPDDVLVWKARVVDREEMPHEFKGTITILR